MVELTELVDIGRLWEISKVTKTSEVCDSRMGGPVVAPVHITYVYIVLVCACCRFLGKLALTSQYMPRTVILMSSVLPLVSWPQPCARSQNQVHRWVSTHTA